MSLREENFKDKYKTEKETRIWRLCRWIRRRIRKEKVDGNVKLNFQHRMPTLNSDCIPLNVLLYLPLSRRIKFLYCSVVHLGGLSSTHSVQPNGRPSLVIRVSISGDKTFSYAKTDRTILFKMGRLTKPKSIANISLKSYFYFFF